MDLDLIDIGTKSKNLLNSSTVSKDLKKDFLKKCLSFYIIVTKYLISKLPLSSKLLKDAQYLDPNKRNSSASLNDVSRLSLKVTSTLKNNLETLFCVSKHTSIEDVCDLIKNQWSQKKNYIQNTYLFFRIVFTTSCIKATNQKYL